ARSARSPRARAPTTSELAAPRAPFDRHVGIALDLLHERAERPRRSADIAQAALEIAVAIEPAEVIERRGRLAGEVGALDVAHETMHLGNRGIGVIDRGSDLRDDLLVFDD